MDQTLDMNSPLPVLRGDLIFHPGPRENDGYPTFTVQDPMSGNYSKLGWAEAEILGRLRQPRTLGELLSDLARHSTLRADPREVAALCKSASSMGLTTDSLTRSVPELLRESEARKVHPLKKALHGYLYFRVPLIRPDEFLTRTLPLVRLLVSGPALALYLVLALAGLYMALERFGQYVHTFAAFMNWQGAAAYGVTLALVKTAHEFAHAYTAKAHKVRVPTMGVAFIVMWPVAFSDVTDAWTLPERSKRLSIGMAGMATETVIAGLCLFGWAVTEPGTLHSVFFITSSVTLASTFLVNLNPAMRYDGYYLLMDLWGVDNMQRRAFTVFRHWYRTRLFGMVLPDPEDGLTPRRRAGMAVYTLYAWTYRFFLYIGIAALVYHAFAKVLGVFLFGVEIWWFLLGPVLREGRALYSERGFIRHPFRLLSTLAVLGALLTWAALPLPRSYSVPAAAVPDRVQVIYAPHPGVISGLSARRGQEMRAGEQLLVLTSDELTAKLRDLKVEREILLRQQELMPLTMEARAYLPQKEDEIAALEARAAGLARLAEQGSIRAELSGRLYEWDDTLYNGRAVAKDEVLGRIADLSRMKVRAWVPEARVAGIVLGDSAKFQPDDGSAPLSGTVISISPVRSANADLPALASSIHGDLQALPDSHGRLRLTDSRFVVEIDLPPSPGLRAGQGGRAWLKTGPKSWIMELMRHAQRILLRESGF